MTLKVHKSELQLLRLLIACMPFMCFSDCKDNKADVSSLYNIADCSQPDAASAPEATTSRPFGRNDCCLCFKRFCSISSLRRHLFTHAGMKYSCTLCDKSFTQSNNLKLHVKFKHGKDELTGSRRRRSVKKKAVSLPNEQPGLATDSKANEAVIADCGTMPVKVECTSANHVVKSEALDSEPGSSISSINAESINEHFGNVEFKPFTVFANPQLNTLALKSHVAVENTRLKTLAVSGIPLLKNVEVKPSAFLEDTRLKNMGLNLSAAFEDNHIRNDVAKQPATIKNSQFKNILVKPSAAIEDTRLKIIGVEPSAVFENTQLKNVGLHLSGAFEDRHFRNDAAKQPYAFKSSKFKSSTAIEDPRVKNVLVEPSVVFEDTQLETVGLNLSAAFNDHRLRNDVAKQPNSFKSSQFKIFGAKSSPALKDPHLKHVRVESPAVFEDTKLINVGFNSSAAFENPQLMYSCEENVLDEFFTMPAKDDDLKMNFIEHVNFNVKLSQNRVGNKCSFCGRSFLSKSAMLHHVITCHLSEETSTRSSGSEMSDQKLYPDMTPSRTYVDEAQLTYEASSSGSIGWPMPGIGDH